jgi:hypothetical protein
VQYLNSNKEIKWRFEVTMKIAIFYDVSFGRPLPMLQRNLLHPSSGQKKMEAAGFSETLVMIYQAIQHNITADNKELALKIF